MPRASARYDTDLDSRASSEGDSDLSSEFEQLNPRVSETRRLTRFPRSDSDADDDDDEEEKNPRIFEATKIGDFRRTKLPFEKSNEIAGTSDTWSLRYFPSGDRSKNYEVTFVEGKRTNLKGKSTPELSRQAKRTPRIVRAIRRGSKKLNPAEDQSPSPQRPHPDNSKSSVVLLYHGKAGSPLPSSRKIQTSKSDQNILKSPLKPEANDQQSHLLVRKKPAESPESPTTRYPLRRRKPARYRRPFARDERFNLKIYQKTLVPRVASPTRRDHWTAPEGILRDPSERQIQPLCQPEAVGPRKRAGNEERNLKERCRQLDQSSTKLMAHRSNSREEGDTKQRQHSEFCPSFLQRMQQVQTRPREAGDKQDGEEKLELKNSEEASRIFPFQATPSGNLKIIPNQVVFESKKVSVLVADPRRTKVNVKAELSRPALERTPSETGSRPAVVDLPPGVTPSTIDQLQAQKRLPTIQGGCRPRTQPYKAKTEHPEMEQKQTAPSTAHRMLPTNEVPLSSLGFTGEQPIDWENIILPDKTDLYQELAVRITNYKNADCIVRLGHDEFHCHLLVLQSYSAFFDERNCKEIDLTDSNVTSRAFSIIYDWMISPISESCHLLRRDNILEIFMAAQHLGIKELEEQCWAFIDNDELFTEDTAFLLYMDARKVGNKAVMELMVPRIMTFFLLLVSTRDFLELSVDELCLLLRSNYICVNSEMEVLMSAVRWLMYDWENRRQHMLDVLKCVRFGLIAPWQLVDVKRNPENPEFMELMSYPEVQKMVDDGLAFVIIKYWYGNQTEDYYHWIDLLGLTEPTDRNWAGEDKNYVTYREFLLYLEEYQRTKIPELKARKSRARPTPPSSPPKENSPLQSSAKGHNYPQNHSHVEGAGQNVVNNNNANEPRSSKHVSKSLPSGYSSLAGAGGMPVPPEILCEYLSSVNQSRTKTNAGSCREGESCETIRVNGGFRASRECFSRSYRRERAGKCQRESRQQHEETIAIEGKLDYEKPKQKQRAAVSYLPPEEANSSLPARKIYGKSLEPEDRTDSAKSEEEAATTIQAIYRGFKVRRRFAQIRKSSSEEKQNARKVAELLAMPGDQPNLHKPLDPVKVSNSCGSQARTERIRRLLATSPRRKRRDSLALKNQSQPNSVKDLEGLRFDVLPQSRATRKRTADPAAAIPTDSTKPIRTIKSPAFATNYDGRTNSLTLSDTNNNTDNDDPFSPRPAVNLNDNNEASRKRSEGDCLDDSQQRFLKARDIETGPSNNKQPLPQRISDSVLGADTNNCFLEGSLFFIDREAVLVFGGIDPHEQYDCTGNSGRAIHRFKPDENTWEFAGEIPEPRHHHSVAFLRGRVYLVGGADPREDDLRRKGPVVGTVWSYDPTARTWMDEPGMITPRKNFALVVSHGKMFAIGGQDRSGTALKNVEAFDPVECAWRETQPMHTARVGPAGVKYRDLIWVAGGMTKSKKDLFSKDVECYDPIQNLWIKAESLRTPRCFASMYVVADCLYIIGGASTTENGIESIDCIDVWDPNLCVWKEQKRMAIARHGHCVGSVGYQLLVIGGVTTTLMRTLNSVECYCCERDKWIKGISVLPRSISGHSTVSLPPANLLIDS